MKNQLFVAMLCSMVLLTCQPQKSGKEQAEESDVIHKLNSNLTNAIIQDGFTPPVASRIYAYCNIAAYESMVQGSSNYVSLSGQLKEFTAVPKVDTYLSYDFRIVMIVAFSKVAKEMVYRDYIIDNIQVKLLDEYKSYGSDQEKIENSIILGHFISQRIVAWAERDGYKESRNAPIYTPQGKTGSWVPTPPTYMDAIEPYWGTLRTFITDSASQFRPLPPDEFSTDSGSAFYKSAVEVYAVVKNLDSVRLKIARHWDCNPQVSVSTGHLMYKKRQLTPGGHWMGITRLATRYNNLSLAATVAAYARVSIAMAEGFISAWDEKFRSHLIRPETYINQYIDADWKPILETPMFPEHTSAHSVISASAATVLTALFGENFEYVDSVNVPFGLPPRNFGSFHEAAAEAAVSRLYGGIHYKPAIDYGVVQGNSIGEFILSNLVTRVH